MENQQWLTDWYTDKHKQTECQHTMVNTTTFPLNTYCNTGTMPDLCYEWFDEMLYHHTICQPIWDEITLTTWSQPMRGDITCHLSLAAVMLSDIFFFTQHWRMSNWVSNMSSLSKKYTPFIKVIECFLIVNCCWGCTQCNDKIKRYMKCLQPK